MLEGWYLITAALLVLSGGTKLRDPEPTRGALRTAGLPASRPAVWTLAGVEIAVGAAAMALPRTEVAMAVALLYLGFAGFVTWALARGLPLQTCGCFGRSDTPPGWVHVAVDASAVIAAVAVALGDGTDLVTMLADQPAAGLPYVGYLALGVYLTALVLTELPALPRGRRQ